MSRAGCDHQWRAMTWKEAYPAANGKVCTVCGASRLGWFADVNAPGGEEANAAAIKAVTGAS